MTHLNAVSSNSGFGRDQWAHICYQERWIACRIQPIIENSLTISVLILTWARGTILIEAIYKRLKVPLKQSYGLREASPLVSARRWEDWNKPIGCSGRLVPSISMKMMSDEKEVSQGREGDIWIKGPNVSKGYYDNPTATAESLDAEGWYRTGDIGYVDVKNSIYIGDRLEELIKYNDFHISPAAPEGLLLLAHPAVSDVAGIGAYSEQRATELPRAVVALANGYKGDEQVEKDLKNWIHTL